MRYSNLGKTFLVLILSLSSLGGMAQVNPIEWSWKAVRVDSNYFEFHLSASIFRGWGVYKANRQEICPYSPIISFEKSLGFKPVGEVDALEGTLCQSGESPPICPIPLYRSNVTFVQVFRMPIQYCGTLRGKIIYQAVSKYIVDAPKTIDFELKVGKPEGTLDLDSLRGTKGAIALAICHHYPKGALNKILWFIGHPFGPYYISKHWN